MVKEVTKEEILLQLQVLEHNMQQFAISKKAFMDELDRVPSVYPPHNDKGLLTALQFYVDLSELNRLLSESVVPKFQAISGEFQK
jgi:hypothetical protein